MIDPVFVLTSPGGGPWGIRQEHQSVGLVVQGIDQPLCDELTNYLHCSRPLRGSGFAKDSGALSSENSLLQNSHFNVSEGRLFSQ